MVHFDFIVSDEEAHTIFECITEEITNTQEELVNMRLARSVDMSTMQHIGKQIEWFEQRVKYLQDLAEKMKNTKIEDEGL